MQSPVIQPAQPATRAISGTQERSPADEREPALDRIESRSPAEVGKRCTSGTSRLAAAGQGWRLVPAAAAVQ